MKLSGHSDRAFIPHSEGSHLTVNDRLMPGHSPLGGGRAPVADYSAP